MRLSRGAIIGHSLVLPLSSLPARHLTGGSAPTARRSTIKILTIMRHGEAAGLGADGDEARALTARGTDDCRRLAAHLKNDGVAWDKIFCSSARRARESAELLAGVMGVGVGVGDAGSATVSAFAPEIRPELYLAGAEGLLAALRALPDNLECVLIVGHNPGLHALTRFLIGRGSGPAARRAMRDCPPGALASFACDMTDWASLDPDRAELRNFLTPGDVN